MSKRVHVKNIPLILHVVSPPVGVGEASVIFLSLVLIAPERSLVPLCPLSLSHQTLGITNSRVQLMFKPTDVRASPELLHTLLGSTLASASKSPRPGF